MTIYVGNLNYKVAENELQDLFAEFGDVKSVKIIKDNATGKPKGFAFIEMEEESAANEAIEALNDSQFMERTLIVNKARPKSNSGNDRPRSNSYGGNRDRGYNKNY